MRKIKWVLIGILTVVFVGVALCLWFTHGYFWSLREMAFHRLLRSLPEPPGWISETAYITTNAYSPSGYRYYEVNGWEAEAVDFFRVEIPQAGWRLLEEKDLLTPSRSEPSTHNHSTELLFSHQDGYCLQVSVVTKSNERGSQTDETVFIHTRISEDTECSFR